MKDVHRRVGQLALVGFAGSSIPQDVRLFAREFDLGGIVLFGRNIEAPEQVSEIAHDAQALADELPLWVSTDQRAGGSPASKRLSPCGRRWPRSVAAATRSWRSDLRARLPLS